ncbi:MAG: peptidoglycan DD-metalloendopeptidase family protein [Rhodospirillaceae bacterium]|nr:peptidoglycan DD-metalloendopeptidase family protein [Rhodospirillaceae bacterium]
MAKSGMAKSGMAKSGLSIIALCLCAVLSTAAVADQRRDIRRDMAVTKDSIAAGQDKQRALANQARAIRDQVDGLRIRAVVAARKTQREEESLGEIEDQLALLHRQDVDYHRRLEQMQASMARSITALARMERQPAAALLAGPGTVLDAARGGRLLATALPALHQDAMEVGKLLNAAGDVRRKLKAEQQRRVAAVATLSGRREELQSLLAARTEAERQLRKAGAVEGRRLSKLVAQAQDLGALLQRLDLDAEQRRKQKQQSAARKAARKASQIATAREARLSELRRRQLAADMARALANTNAKSKGGGNKSDQKGQHPQTKKQRLASRSGTGQVGRGTLPFSKIKGHLRLPANGSWAGKYGESTGFGPRAQGITLQTRRGAQVVAPYDGKVVFAGQFRKYGLILIISHGEGYHTLLAGLTTLQATVGQNLLTGEPVGRMGEAGKRSLYVELRRKGVAINPNSWWSKSRERASG